MKCIKVNNQIDRFMAQQLSQVELFAFKQHVLNCTDCAAKLETASALLSGLQNLPVPDPTASFEQRVFAEVRRQHKDNQRSNHDLRHDFRFASGFATAAIAGLVIWFASSVYLPNTFVEQPQMISVAINQSQTVRLVFDSPADMQQVSLSIGLPDNMALEGYPGRKELAWKTNLHKGSNVLALPVTAIGFGQGELLAKLTYNNKVREFRIVLKTTIDGVQLYQLSESKSV